MPSKVSHKLPNSVPSIARIAHARLLRLLVVLGFAAMLGACSKCAVPTWHSSLETTPAACHDGPPLQ